MESNETKTTENPKWEEYTPKRADEAIYADGANVLATMDTPQDTRIRLRNYGAATAGGGICAEWKKVQLLTQQTKKQQKKLNQLLPETFGKIQQQTTALAIGKT